MTTLVAFGDLMLGDSATTVGFGIRSRYPKERLSLVLADLRALIGPNDLVIGNLECPLARWGAGRTRLARDQMRGDPDFARVLKEAGFGAVGVANNHAMQHGPHAFHETIQVLSEAGILPFGLRGAGPWASEPVRLQVPGVGTVGILGYSWRPRQYSAKDPLYAEGDVESVLSDVSRLRPSVDRLVLSLHWGDEFFALPAARDRAFAHAAAEAGVDVLIGHHPHVVRPVERFGRSVVAYSLGNAVSDMIWWEPLRLGLALRVRLNDLHAESVTLRTDDAYVARVLSDWTSISGGPCIGASDSEYATQVRHSLREHRSVAYRYAARNVLKYPVVVGAELVCSTLYNKLAALWGDE